MRRRDFLAASLALGAASSAFAQPVGPAEGLTLAPIEPTNDLERAFLAAFTNADARPEFRRLLLVSEIALSMQSSASDSLPRFIDTPDRGQAAFIFTSAARHDLVMGPTAPRRMLTGRAAFERLRGKHIVLNWRLSPMLTLEPEDVAGYLQTSAGPAE